MALYSAINHTSNSHMNVIRFSLAKQATLYNTLAVEIESNLSQRLINNLKVQPPFHGIKKQTLPLDHA